MKRQYIYLLIFFTILFTPKTINAASNCDYKNLSDYRSLAGNINVTYSYRMEEGKPVFDVTISNIYDDMYIIDTYQNKQYTKKDFTSDNELIIKGYPDDLTLRYQVYGYIFGCPNQQLITKYVTLPNYNEFSTDKACVGAEEYSLCQRWGAVSVDYEEFLSKVQAYKERKKAQNNPIIFDDEKTFWDYVFTFVGNYYVYLVSLVIIIILLTAAIKKTFIKKNEFDFKV